MISIAAFSGKKSFVAALAVAALAFLPTRAAHAAQFNYVFSGYADGTNETLGMSFLDIPFTLSFAEDTSAIDNHGDGTYSYDNVDATLVAGGGTFTLTDVTLEVNGNAGIQSVSFFNSGASNGLGFSMVTPVGYDLMSNLDVAPTGADLSPIIPPSGTGAFSDTTGDTLQFTGDETLGFTAMDPPAPAPEPSSLLLLTSGLPGLALLRRRCLKA